MKYVKLVIAIKDEYQESIIAELSEMEFDGFQQLEDEVVTYIPKERFHIGNRERIERLLAGFQGEGYIRSEEVVVEQNWNAEWEKTIQPQSIGQFFVKPTWATKKAEEGQTTLEIDPKMAFGTGYHETTQLMLRQLPKIIEKGQTVLDAGTGTGILAIAAAKLGASHVLGFDIDEWSVTNARENIYLNGVAEQISVEQGTHVEVEVDKKYDVILANIHQQVIADMIPFFSQSLKEDGQLLLSGLLENDENIMREILHKNEIDHHQTFQLNEWICIWAEK
jgi:ribosomal protein L11 methyltransferase